jgi:hypothetical protein
MTATHHQSASARFYDYFRRPSRQVHSLLSLAHVDRRTSIYMEGTYLFVLLSQGATTSLEHPTHVLPIASYAVSHSLTFSTQDTMPSSFLTTVIHT